MLELFDTPEIPLLPAECARVLRFGGRLAVVALALHRQATVLSRACERAHRAFPPPG